MSVPFAFAFANAASGSSTYTASVTTSTAAGDTLTVAVTANAAASGPLTVADSKGNTYYLLKTVIVAGTVLSVFESMGVTAALVSGTDTVTATMAGTGSAVNIIGIDQPGQWSPDMTAIGFASGTSGTSQSAVTGALEFAGETVLAFELVGSVTPTWQSPAVLLKQESGSGAGFGSAAYVTASGTSPVTVTSTTASSAPVWAVIAVPFYRGSPTAYLAARNGFPADTTAVNHVAQIGQFLASHGITPVYQGVRTWTVAQNSAAFVTWFAWKSQNVTGWLTANDADQPFVLPGGQTAIGRIAVPVQAFGNGADLKVTLYPDNGSGNPLIASPLASTILPAAHIATLGVMGSLASAGPLAVSRYNTCYLGASATIPWSQPAVTSGGAGNFATPVTSGNWTLFIGGTDNSGTNAIAVVTAVQYLGGGTVSGAIPQPPLPQATTTTCAAATADTVIVAGGFAGSTAFTNVWTASWDPSTGTLGAWSAQQALPQACINGGMATWTDSSGNEYVYVAAGATATGGATTASPNSWYASVVNGQVTAWTAGPALPVGLYRPFMAVVGDWLIVAGGVNPAGTTQSATWYAQIGSGGVPGPWQAGPALPQPAFTDIPGWNLIATDSAMILASGAVTGGGGSDYAQVLAVSPDGPAPAWQLQIYAFEVFGQYQVAAYPAGDGSWEAVGFQLTSYASAALTPVPLASIPLPASGLTPGNTYHVLFHQLGGDQTNNYLQIGAMAAAPSLEILTAVSGSGGPWTALTSEAIAMDVYDQSPGGQPWHLWQDSGAGITTLVEGAAAGQLLGAAESAAFPSGSPEPVLASVTQVTYGSTGLPSGTVQLA